MKYIGDYKGYKVYQTELRHASANPKTDTIYSVSSSSGYDAIYLGEKVGHFDHVYCVDWFSEEKVDELYTRWKDAEIKKAKEAEVRESTPTFVKEASWSEPASTDFWSDLTKKIDDILASVK